MFNFFRRPDPLTFEQIRAETDRLRALIGAPADLCPLSPAMRGDGSPFLRIVADGYIYANEERGHVYNERKTQDLDKLLYWIMKDITHSMASEYELANRVPKTDFRRMLFAKDLELLGSLKPEWRERKQREYDAVLAQYPFNDEIGYKAA